jgi:hypothetical protein
MTTQFTRFRSLKSLGGAAVAALGILVLLGGLDHAVPQLSHALCCKVLGVLPSVVPGALEAIRNSAFDHQRLAGCLLHMLLSFLPFLLVTAAAI